MIRRNVSWWRSWMFAVLIVATAGAAASAQIPPGYSPIRSWTGVTVYRDGIARNYVTVVDLKQARLVSLTGSVSGAPNGIFGKKQMASFWSDAVGIAGTTRVATVVVNGAFFTDMVNPTTTLSHGLKAFGRVLSYGADVRDGQTMLVTFMPGSPGIKIASYSRSTFDARDIPEVIGAHTVTTPKDPNNGNVQRTFLGISDADRDGKNDRVCLLSSKGATQTAADATLRGFGATATAMLDGGSSAGLVVDGGVVMAGRVVPHAVAVLAPR